MAVNKNTFASMTNLVIDKLEGGYYNPAWHYTSAMGGSGETMFGIDRTHFDSPSSATAKFWSIIDSKKDKNTWRHGYIPSEPLKSQLKALVVEMLYPLYESWTIKYLTPKAKELVDSDERLIFNFVYAVWNGAGYFQKFAVDTNNAVSSGIKDTTKLANRAIEYRKNYSGGSSFANSIISKSGYQLEKIFTGLTGYVKKNKYPIIIGSGLIAVAVVLTWKYKLLKFK